VPRYLYHCHFCHADFFVHHMMSELQTECIECGMTEISKLPTIPLHIKRKEKKQAVGNITKQHIEDNKKILEDMKEKVKEKAYKEKKE
jgi:putative FmdB family regulatory protein